MPMNDIMIDIEALGKAPNAPILSIGAVAFDRVTGYVGSPDKKTAFYTCVDVVDSCRYSVPDGDTVRWWMLQPDEARQTVMSGTISLDTALDLLSLFIVDIERACVGSEIRIWGNGPTYDMTNLESAYQAVGKAVPWGFRAVRCFRTLRDMAGEIPPLSAEGVAHHALSDATWQAKMAVRYFRALRGEAD